MMAIAKHLGTQTMELVTIPSSSLGFAFSGVLDVYPKSLQKIGDGHIWTFHGIHGSI